MNNQLRTFMTTAGTVISLMAITFTAAASSPKVSASSLAGAASQRSAPLAPAPFAPAAACTKLQASEVYWVALDQEGNIGDKVDIYPSGTPTITAAFDYNCVPKKTKMAVVWSIDGEQVYTSNETPKANDKADTYSYSLYKKDSSALDDGEYGVEFYLGQDLLTSGTVTVGGEITDTNVVTDTSVVTDTATEVSVQGTVVDSKSKKPINGAIVVVLNEGVDGAQWLKDGSDSDVMAFSKTDSKGQFELNNRVPVGKALPWLIGAKGYKTIYQSDYTIAEGADDPFVLNIALERSK